MHENLDACNSTTTQYEIYRDGKAIFINEREKTRKLYHFSKRYVLVISHQLVVTYHPFSAKFQDANPLRFISKLPQTIAVIVKSRDSFYATRPIRKTPAMYPRQVTPTTARSSHSPPTHPSSPLPYSYPPHFPEYVSLPY